MLREIRQWITAQARNTAAALAPRLSRQAADRLGAIIAHVGPHVPVLARQVADNMRSAGIYSRRGHRDYFAGLAEHFAGALQVLRCAAGSTELTAEAGSTGLTAEAGSTELTVESRDAQSPSPVRLSSRPKPEFMQLVRERIGVDASVDQLRDSLVQGRGAIILSPHINNYFMNVARLNEQVPLTVYMRWVNDPQRQAAKDKWYRVSGCTFISQPPDGGGPLGRMKRMAEVIEAGRPLMVLVDLTQKREDGVAVRFFGREVYLPAGAAVLALRTAAPVFVMTAYRAEGRQVIQLHGPYRADRRADRQAGVQRILQTFADHLERMLIEQPGLWYLWADKRWTRTFRGDPRYTQPM